jgi:hypothetical protein
MERTNDFKNVRHLKDLKINQMFKNWKKYIFCFQLKVMFNRHLRASGLHEIPPTWGIELAWPVGVGIRPRILWN